MDCIHVVIPFTKTTSNLALASGRIHKWLKNNGFPIRTSEADLCLENLSFFRSLSESNISHLAAKNGRIDCLEVLKVDLDSELLECAAIGGQLEVVEWIHDRNPQIDFDISLVAYAAVNGDHLDILKWLHSHDYQIPTITLAFSADIGQLELVKWLIEEKIGTDYAVTYISHQIALHKGHKEITELLNSIL